MHVCVCVYRVNCRFINCNPKIGNKILQNGSFDALIFSLKFLCKKNLSNFFTVRKTLVDLKTRDYFSVFINEEPVVTERRCRQFRDEEN